MRKTALSTSGLVLGFAVFATAAAAGPVKTSGAGRSAAALRMTPPVLSAVYGLTALSLRRPTVTLAPSPSRIGVYTGTFDPVHAGHLAVIDRAMEAMGLDRMVIIPNVKPNGKEHSLPFDLRWRMMAQLAAQRPDLILPPKDVLRGLMNGPGGPDRIMAWVQKQYSQDALIYHVMGTDSFARLLAMSCSRDKLYGPQRTELVVMERPGYERPRGTFPANVHWVDMPSSVRYLSSEIRKDPLRYEAKVPEPVALEIKRLGLYGRSQERGFYDLPPFMRKWLALEQTLNDDIEELTQFDRSRGSGLSPRYLPKNRPIFPIETVEVPLDEARLIAVKTLPEQIVFEKHGKRFVRFFIHPESRSFFLERLKMFPWKKEFLATPTSSHRSLVVWNPKTNDPPLGLKVSLNVSIGDSVRLVTRRQIERATAVSALLKTIPASELSQRGISFMDEPGGAVLNGFEFGFNLRSLPLDLAPDAELVPMFSLYSKPSRGPPRIVALARASGLSDKEFIRQRIVEPMVEQAGYLAFQHGLVGEVHEQNILVELRGGRLSGRFWYRDLSGYQVNPGLRAAAGKSMDFMPSGITPDVFNIEWADFIFQVWTYMGRYNLLDLQKAFVPYAPEITRDWLCIVLRQALAKTVGEWTGRKADGYRAMKHAITQHVKKRRA